MKYYCPKCHEENYIIESHIGVNMEHLLHFDNKNDDLTYGEMNVIYPHPPCVTYFCGSCYYKIASSEDDGIYNIDNLKEFLKNYNKP